MINLQLESACGAIHQGVFTPRLRALKKTVKQSDARQTSLSTDLLLAAHGTDNTGVNVEAEKELSLTGEWELISWNLNLGI
jgi:hypothetical protein